MLQSAIATVVRATMRDTPLVDGEDTPAAIVEHARNTLVLPGRHALGAWTIDPEAAHDSAEGRAEYAALVEILEASDDEIAAALEVEHSAYPHHAGQLYDCAACDSSCYCVPGSSECVFEGPHSGYAVEASQ